MLAVSLFSLPSVFQFFVFGGQNPLQNPPTARQVIRSPPIPRAPTCRLTASICTSHSLLSHCNRKNQVLRSCTSKDSCGAPVLKIAFSGKITSSEYIGCGSKDGDESHEKDEKQRRPRKKPFYRFTSRESSLIQLPCNEGTSLNNFRNKS